MQGEADADGDGWGNSPRLKFVLLVFKKNHVQNVAS